MDSIVNYLKESVDELVNKVTWPTWSKLQNSAIVVLLATLIFSVVVFGMDYIFGVNPGESSWKGLIGFIYNVLS